MILSLSISLKYYCFSELLVQRFSSVTLGILIRETRCPLLTWNYVFLLIGNGDELTIGRHIKMQHPALFSVVLFFSALIFPLFFLCLPFPPILYVILLFPCSPCITLVLFTFPSLSSIFPFTLCIPPVPFMLPFSPFLPFDLYVFSSFSLSFPCSPCARLVFIYSSASSPCIPLFFLCSICSPCLFVLLFFVLLFLPNRYTCILLVLLVFPFICLSFPYPYLLLVILVFSLFH